ncbi:hypothetical protein SELMODRAFT_421226 [Selaginella moellendorffii]|uniref:Uncharacterized protein n=1 Tax=Selaginella moellendorffii TaxID=88036 RepID=D8SEE6_SELML|nr:hypothetical protein SELMODRAFT_421226 [Selaginella moellendorffii]
MAVVTEIIGAIWLGFSLISASQEETTTYGIPNSSLLLSSKPNYVGSKQLHQALEEQPTMLYRVLSNLRTASCRIMFIQVFKEPSNVDVKAWAVGTSIGRLSSMNSIMMHLASTFCRNKSDFVASVY